MDHFDLAT